jgi:hypothetical protein
MWLCGYVGEREREKEGLAHLADELAGDRDTLLFAAGNTANDLPAPDPPWQRGARYARQQTGPDLARFTKAVPLERHDRD